MQIITRKRNMSMTASFKHFERFKWSGLGIKLILYKDRL